MKNRGVLCSTNGKGNSKVFLNEHLPLSQVAPTGAELWSPYEPNYFFAGKGMVGASKSPDCISSRGLCDITNTMDAVKSKLKEEKLKVPPTVDKGVVERLSLENDMLRKGIAQRDQIIELHIMELQKLKASLMKLTQQNRHFVQTNSQLLADLNIARDKLKLVEHEFGCASAMLKAKVLELEGKGTACCHHVNGSHSIEKEPLPEPTKPMDVVRCRRSSMASSQTERDVNTQNKRICTRRQSSIGKSEEPEGTGEFLKIEETVPEPNSQVCDISEDAFTSSLPSFPTADEPHKCKAGRKRKCEKGELKENGTKKPKPRTDSQTNGFMKDGIDDTRDNCKINGEKKELEENDTLMSDRPVGETPQMTASSNGRPVRRASLKVATYKERPLNIKMRR